MPETSKNQSLREAVRLTRAKSSRLSWALKAYGHLLAAAVKADTSPEAREVEKLPEEQISEHLAQLILDRADPTAAKTMTAWLVRQYAHGGLRLEDTGTAYETLEMFERYGPRLPEGLRDLGQYASLAQVWEAVLPLATAEQNKLSGKAQKTLDRDKAYAESRILRQDPDGFTIAVPLTEFAAKWWGRGTRWCTAAEKANQFSHYHKDAPLIVMVIPELGDRGKFQMWVTRDDIQLMDAADRPVLNALIESNWERFEPLVQVAFLQNGAALSFFPQSLRSPDLCRIAIEGNGRALMHAPKNLYTEDLYKLAVAQNGEALGLIEYDLRTPELCRIAVEQNGLALADVPERFRTVDICRIAVEQNGWALDWVPKDLCSEELCRIAVTQNGWNLQVVPRHVRTDTLCRIAVERDGGVLGFVPEHLRTAELCSMAVAQNGLAIGDVPSYLQSEELYRIAVSLDGEALFRIPELQRNEDLCRIAVMQNPKSIRHVPDHLQLKIAPFARHKDVLPEAPIWDISLLDRLEEALRPPEESLNRSERRPHA